MEETRTTAAVQGYLDDLATGKQEIPAEPIIRALLGRSAARLQVLCGNMLYRSYPRLTCPPMNVETDELLGAVVARLIRALREIRPQNIRQFFALANQHMRWELNDLARRLDEQERVVELRESFAQGSAPSKVDLNPKAQRMLNAIENLPDEEREVLGLVRLQGLTHGEAAEILDISPKTVQRRLNRAMVLMSKELGETSPPQQG